MPLATDEDSSGLISPSVTGFAPTPVTSINITDPEYQDIAVDTKNNPLSTLLTHVEGSSWTVEYYSQILNSDSQLSSQQVSVSPAYQQYRRVRGLEIKVTKAIAPQQDPETNMMSMDGTANTIAGTYLKPNMGDMFIANIGVGPTAIFRVTASKKNSYLANASYEIDYAMVSTEQTLKDDLEAKTVEDLTYRADFQNRGQGPFIQTEEVTTLDEIGDVVDRLTQQYLEKMFEPEFQTWIVPDQAVSIYDPFLTNFLTRYISRNASALVQDVRVLNVSDDLACRQDNFWTALEKRDATYLKTGFTKVGLTYCSQFSNNPFASGIRWTGINCCVYPTNPRLGVGGLKAGMVKPLAGSAPDPDTLQPFSSQIDDEYTPLIVPDGTLVVAPTAVLADPTSPTPVNTMYPPTNTAALSTAQQTGNPIVFTGVMVDNYYVLSQKFYAQDVTMSVLESAVWSYLNEEALDASQLVKTAALTYGWGIVEQFYCIPILIVLLRSIIDDYQE